MRMTRRDPQRKLIKSGWQVMVSQCNSPLQRQLDCDETAIRFGQRVDTLIRTATKNLDVGRVRHRGTICSDHL